MGQPKHFCLISQTTQNNKGIEENKKENISMNLIPIWTENSNTSQIQWSPTTYFCTHYTASHGGLSPSIHHQACWYLSLNSIEGSLACWRSDLRIPKISLNIYHPGPRSGLQLLMPWKARVPQAWCCPGD